jgi:aspartyl-tRNA(Asn)/glutamyl-tRNA(Gln) amidotransferase subunit C
MSINIETIRYISNLAKIRLTSQEEELFAKQLNDILIYVAKLNTVDTNNTEPMSHTFSIDNVLRDDTVKDSLTQEEALKNAPQKEKAFFKVPKIIE